MMIYASEYIECFFAPSRSRKDILLITFNEMGMLANGGRFWGKEVAAKLGMSVLGFISRTPNWFPAQDMSVALERVKEQVGAEFPIRVTYGQSMGGYGAIRYAHALGAKIALAFSPQYSIDPDDVQDIRFNKFFDPRLNAGMAIAGAHAAPATYVFFDPSDQLDRLHAEAIARVVDTNLLPMIYGGHNPITVFKGSRNLGELLELVVAGDVAGTRRLTNRLRRRDRVQRPRYVAMNAVERHPVLAHGLFKTYGANIGAYWYPAFCFRLGQAGMGAEALALLDEAPPLAGKEGEIKAVRAHLLHGLGELEAALESARGALALKPQDGAMNWLVGVLEDKLAAAGAT